MAAKERESTVDALFLAEVIDEAWGIPGEAVQEARQGHFDLRSLFVQLADEQSGVEVVDPAQERGRPPHIDLPGLQGSSREVAAVVGDDRLGVGANRRGQDMPVSRNVCHDADDRLEALDPRLREMPAQLFLAPACLARKRAPRAPDATSQ